MKNERRNQFKSNNLGNNTIILFVVICLAICCIWSTFTIFKTKNVYAEETETLTTPQILNFNQYVPNANITMTSITRNQNGFYNIYNTSSFTFVANHKYYMFGTPTSTYAINVCSGSNWTNFSSAMVIENGYTSKIYTTSVDRYGLQLYCESNNASFENFNIIDLTQMYGENTPTLEECETIFKSNYYSYTTGTPINENYFSNYLDAYNDILQSYKYQLSTTALSNYTFSYDYNGDESYFEYRDDGTQTWYFLNTFAVPLFTKINANAQVTINYYFYAPNFTLNYYLNVMAYDSNGNLITIFTESNPIDTGNEQQTTFTLPFDVDVLFFNCRYNNNIVTSANFMLYNFELSANQLDLTTLAFNAQESAREYYELYYGVGGQGYNNIYNAGYGAGSESQKPFTDTWDFIGQSFHGVGEILGMELIPGLPLGLFVALPLLVGLLFFIVKIAKGSGG